MELFIRKPNIDMHTGVTVTKDFEAEFENESVKQTIKNLVLRTVMKISGEGYEGTYDTTVYLSPGDILIYEDGRGYIKPLDGFCTVAEAIEDMKCLGE